MHISADLNGPHVVVPLRGQASVSTQEKKANALGGISLTIDNGQSKKVELQTYRGICRQFTAKSKKNKQKITQLQGLFAQKGMLENNIFFQHRRR